jgi:hypothetical protein
MELLAFAISDRHINPFAAIIFYAPIVTLLLVLVINLTERIADRRLAARAAEWVRVRDAQRAAHQWPDPASFTLPGDFVLNDSHGHYYVRRVDALGNTKPMTFDR